MPSIWMSNGHRRFLFMRVSIRSLRRKKKLYQKLKNKTKHNGNITTLPQQPQQNKQTQVTRELKETHQQQETHTAVDKRQ